MASVFSLFLLYITNICLVSGFLFNAALYKPAYMNSVWPGTIWTADKANDGNDDTEIRNGHCACTNVENPGWWMVDLRGLYTVEQIVLVNRGDDYGSAMRTERYQFDVFESDPRLSRGFPMEFGHVCYTRNESVGQGETLIKNCTTPILGRFVRFIRYTENIFNVCEIKVMASFATSRESFYAATPNAVLQFASFFTTYTDSSLSCTSMCLQRRDSDTCTAVNWVRTTKQCQMLKVDPRKVPTLTPDTITDFYKEG